MPDGIFRLTPYPRSDLIGCRHVVPVIAADLLHLPHIACPPLLKRRPVVQTPQWSITVTKKIQDLVTVLPNGFEMLRKERLLVQPCHEHGSDLRLPGRRGETRLQLDAHVGDYLVVQARGALLELRTGQTTEREGNV